MPPETQRPTAGPALVVWFVLRLLLLLGAAVELIVGFATRSIAAMIVVAALTVVCALLDAWVLRLRHVEQPLDGGVRATSVIDTWQPVAAFAWLSQIGHVLDGSTAQHVALAVLGVATLVVIFASRRAYV